MRQNGGLCFTEGHPKIRKDSRKGRESESLGLTAETALVWESGRRGVKPIIS